MCLARAFMNRHGDNELILGEVVSAEQLGDTLVLTTLFRETREVKARVKRIDFADSSIILESTA